MAIPNLISLLCLSGIIVHETRKYLWRDRLDRDMEENEIDELEEVEKIQPQLCDEPSK